MNFFMSRSCGVFACEGPSPFRRRFAYWVRNGIGLKLHAALIFEDFSVAATRRNSGGFRCLNRVGKYDPELHARGPDGAGPSLYQARGPDGAGPSPYQVYSTV